MNRVNTSRIGCILTFAIFISVHSVAQLAPLRLAKSRKSMNEGRSWLGQDTVIESLKPKAPLPAAAQRPAIATVSTLKAGLNSIIKITGTHFDQNTRVTFGNTPAIEVVVASDTELKARVGAGASGNIVVTNSIGASDPVGNFVYVKPPTISGVSHKMQQGSSSITISGENYDGDVSISINGEDPVKAFVLSDKQIFLPMNDAVTITHLALFTPGGEVDYPTDGADAPAAAANADLNLPDFGNGLTLIPTPQFDYARIAKKGGSSFNVRLWGNALGTDSSIQKVGTKFLSPDLSSFGLRIEEDIMLNKNDGSSWLFAMEANVLVKKVSYFDAKAGSTTDFTPSVIHPRLGFIKTFQHNNGLVSLYGNFPAIVGSNDQFADFFHTGAKNVFFYPEMDFAYLLPVGGNGNQSLKFQVSIVDNNGDAQFLTASHDNLLYYFKFGFVSSF